MSKRGTCCVVDSIECLAAPSSEENAGPVGECFGCGDDVCIACSRRVVWHDYGRKRVCVNCIENEKPMTAKPTRPRVKRGASVWVVEYHSFATIWIPWGKAWMRQREAAIEAKEVRDFIGTGYAVRVARYVRAERGK